MSCYFRHLNELFKEAGIEVTSANRKRVDQAIHQIVGVPHKECPQTWKKLKLEVLNDRQSREEFINRLKQAIV